MTEELLANAVAHQETAAAVLERLVGDDGARDQAAAALAALDSRGPFAEPAERLRNLMAELDDLADTVRRLAEGIEPDPEALDHVQARRPHAPRPLSQVRRRRGRRDR